MALGVPGVDVLDLIQAHRRHLVEAMQRYTRLKEDATEDEVALALVVDAEIYRLGGGHALARRRPRPGSPGVSPPSTRPDRGTDHPSRASPLPPSPWRSPMTAALELREVSKVYGTGDPGRPRPRRRGPAVDVGELVAVMGPSGIGKSTLLTIAGSLEEPTAGQVLVAGAALSSMSRNDRARLRRRSVGFVFQDFNLLAGLPRSRTCRCRSSWTATAPRRPARPVSPPSTSSGVADRADRFPDELSGGERQRVAIARAVVGERRLLLADEPTGALDSVNGEAVMRLLRAACKRGVAGVMVTHDAQLASWADRVVFLRDGRVVDQTAPPAGPESLLGTRATGMQPDDPPAAAGLPARRAVIRWAWRMFRREWRQQVLVLPLLTTTVAAAVARHRRGVQLGRPTPTREFGEAEAADPTSTVRRPRRARGRPRRVLRIASVRST